MVYNKNCKTYYVFQFAKQCAIWAIARIRWNLIFQKTLDPKGPTLIYDGEFKMFMLYVSLTNTNVYNTCREQLLFL